MNVNGVRADRKKINKRWTILIPVIMFIYIIAYIDRVNIGFGLTQIRESLNMSASQAGFASGIFFIGYLILQVPGATLRKNGARRKSLLFLWCSGALWRLLRDSLHLSGSFWLPGFY